MAVMQRPSLKHTGHTICTARDTHLMSRPAWEDATPWAPRPPATLCETCCEEGPSRDKGPVAGQPTSPARGSLVPEPTVTLNVATSVFGACQTLACPQHSPQRCTEGPSDEPTLGTKAADAWTSQKAPILEDDGHQPVRGSTEGLTTPGAHTPIRDLGETEPCPALAGYRAPQAPQLAADSQQHPGRSSHSIHAAHPIDPSYTPSWWAPGHRLQAPQTPQDHSL